MSDAVLLAWAAGFFDAEGSTVVRLAGATRERAYMRAQIPQSDRCGGREVLERFRAAVNGTGSISEPDAEGVQCFYTTSTLPTIVVMRLLLPQLGLVKRTQLRDCAATTMAALRTVRRPGGPTGITRMQLGDSLSALIRDLEQTNLGPFGQLEEQLGWAAGLFDGDGSTNMSRTRTTKTTSELLRAAVSQSSDDGVPSVLLRFKDVVGFGSIYGPYHRRDGCLPEYEWVASRSVEVARLVEMLGAHLSEAKRAQARDAFRSYVLEGVRRGMRRAWL